MMLKFLNFVVGGGMGGGEIEAPAGGEFDRVLL